MKFISLLFFSSMFTWTVTRAQNSVPLNFDAKKIGKNFQFEIANNTDSTKFYHIGIDAYVDTGWMHLSSNIDAIGKKQFLKLKSINARAVSFQTFYSKTLKSVYKMYRIRKIRFSLSSYALKNFDSIESKIYSNEF